MKDNNIITVLSTIKEYCKSKDPSIVDCCANCPFNIENSWAKFCMFSGPHFNEGVIPEDWKTELLDCDKINNELKEN